MYVRRDSGHAQGYAKRCKHAIRPIMSMEWVTECLLTCLCRVWGAVCVHVTLHYHLYEPSLGPLPPSLPPHVVQDQGCLPGLVLFLDDQDEKVVLTSLQALSYLAEEPANCPVMKNEIGLTESLKIISKKCVRLSTAVCGAVCCTSNALSSVPLAQLQREVAQGDTRPGQCCP